MPAYATTEEANTYFASRLHIEAWMRASTCDKGKALDMATRAIDRTPLKGVKASYDQANQFPRYPDAEVPQAVKDACCEEALALLERGNSQRRKLQQEGVASFSVGGLSETYVAGARGGGLISQEAKELLRPWLLGAVSIT
ncbi:MAG TPA: hypothetical protein GX716_06080 [Firmicutes bacterium]|nr:hypothetical protein [Candidatus Fermentithermobacillaceae bacterium]